jgi:RecA/RadA recombinase
MRVKDADDFYKKMEYFDANPDKRIKMIQYLQELLISDAYTGKFMIDLINKSLAESDTDVIISDSDEALFPKKTKKIAVTKKVSLF